MKKIPKIIHFYWDGSLQSYLQHLTVVSFKKHNPDWEVNLFMPKSLSKTAASWVTNEQRDRYTGEDYLEETKKLCTVRLVDFEDNLHEIHRSDLIRWKVLYEYGGVWSDMDILYIKPVVKVKTTAIVFDGEHHIIGFYITKPRQPIFKTIYSEATELAKQYPKKYQALGSTLLNRIYSNVETLDVTNLPMDIVYPYNEHSIEDLFFKDQDKTTPNTIGIHWYNGSPTAKKYQNNFDKYRSNGSVISKRIAECLV